jgi:hypothetical protein
MDPCPWDNKGGGIIGYDHVPHSTILGHVHGYPKVGHWGHSVTGTRAGMAEGSGGGQNQNHSILGDGWGSAGV